MKTIGIAFLLCVTGVRGADTGWTTTHVSRVPATQQLRAYGRVATEFVEMAGPKAARAWVLRFRCANRAKAATVVGKCLSDLTLSHGVKPTKVGGVPALVAFGGAVFVGCVDGAEARLVCAESPGALAGLLAGRPELAGGAVAKAHYPAFLDRFDRYGWGCYGMGGFCNFHDWMRGVDGKRTPKDPTEDVAFMIKHRFRFEPWLDPAGFDTSDGIIKNTENEWMVKQLTDAGMPFSFRVYGAAGGADWTARRFPEYIEQPAPFLLSGWHGPNLHHKSQPHLTWFNRDIHRYMAAKTMAMMRQYVDHPLNMGWMHPHGELEHDPWYDRHDDYSPTARRSWQAYLRKTGLALADVSRMFGRADRPFGDWQQVPIPEFATFAGLGARIQSLAGRWFWRRGRVTTKKEDANFPGLAQKWYAQPIDTATWQATTLPGGDHLFDVLPRSLGWFSTTWFRRSFTLTPAQLGRRPIYLYWFPLNHGVVHSGKHGRYHGVFINGKQAGGIGIWGALDVTKLLRPGDNQIAVQLFGPVWNGRIFLSTAPPKVYPYLGRERNRLFVLWQQWHTEA